MKTDIFVKNMETIKKIARNFSYRYDNKFEVDELINAAYIGFNRAITNNPALIEKQFSKLNILLFRVKCDMIDYINKELGLRRENPILFIQLPVIHVPVTEWGYKSIDTRDHVEHLISTLSDEDWIIIQGYFYDEKPLKQIGEDLGINESSIWQKREKAYAHMRNIDKVISLD